LLKSIFLFNQLGDVLLSRLMLNMNIFLVLDGLFVSKNGGLVLQFGCGKGRDFISMLSNSLAGRNSELLMLIFKSWVSSILLLSHLFHLRLEINSLRFFLFAKLFSDSLVLSWKRESSVFMSSCQLVSRLLVLIFMTSIHFIMLIGKL